jgi:putative hydrolase of HD superfamily
VSDDRLARQVAFLTEADKLKTILRRTPITDGSRAENTKTNVATKVSPL